MGAFFSKKNTFAKELADLEEKIINLEDYVSNARTTQHNVFVKVIIYSIVLEIILAAYIYYQTRSINTLYGKLIYASYLLLFPLVIFIATKIFNALYKKIITRNEKKLESLKNRLQSKIDERKKETDYENTQKLIDKYDKLMKKNKNANNINNSGSGGNNSGNNLRHRNVTGVQQSPIRTGISPIGQQLHLQPQPLHNPYQYPSSPSSPLQPSPPQQFPSPQRPVGAPLRQNSVGSLQPQHNTPTRNNQPPTHRSNNQTSSWLDKLVDYLISDGPKYGSPLICKKCHSHNGYVPTGEISTVQFRCRFCQYFNQNGVDDDGDNNNNNSTPSPSSSSSSNQLNNNNNNINEDSKSTPSSSNADLPQTKVSLAKQIQKELKEEEREQEVKQQQQQQQKSKQVDRKKSN